MSESQKKFDATAFAASAKQAYSDGTFLTWLSENEYTRGHEHFECITARLVNLHKAQEIDLVAAVLNDEQLSGSQHQFWQLQNLFCKLIPEIEAETASIIKLVDKLVKLGGNDFAAYEPNRAFREWLTRRPDQTGSLLEQFRVAPSGAIGKLTFVFEAGVTHDFRKYHDEAIAFLSDARADARLPAITALGRIDASADPDRQRLIIEALCTHLDTTTDNTEQANTIGALLDAFAKQPTIEAELVLKATASLKNSTSDEVHYNLARALGQHHAQFELKLQLAIIEALENVNPSMNEVVQQVDFAFSQCINEGNQDTIAHCLQGLLDHPVHPLKLDELQGFVHRLPVQHSPVFNWLIIHWLRHGSHKARSALVSLMKPIADDRLSLSLDVPSFGFSDRELVFVSRKALGYLLVDSATAAEILIACLRSTKSKKAADAIADLLFDPLMINYSGQAASVVKEAANKRAPRQKQFKAALKKLDAYWDAIKAVPPIPEFSPSASQRRAHRDRERHLFEDSFKDARKSSALLSIIPIAALLFGVGSASYGRDKDGKLRRNVIMLATHSTSVEFPRLNTINPIALEEVILQFRSEKL